MWLHDGLASDLKAQGVRVLTYGYHSHLVQNKGLQNIEDFASTFRVALLAIRRSANNAMLRWRGYPERGRRTGEARDLYHVPVIAMALP